MSTRHRKYQHRFPQAWQTRNVRAATAALRPRLSRLPIATECTRVDEDVSFTLITRRIAPGGLIYMVLEALNKPDEVCTAMQRYDVG